ncbi:Peridinin-chlorophyll a-binding protein, chloroplastic [Symbiodinium microadriaticum]|uniref:Peridinin-chlorophyll a-binding protein, chloroplastic n=1 Tax=Symbiodinium microadriaticum TaxID=2951 RepID=A0A1Q9C1P1_SYMMI|nr:Peridinin-chlorophyll a-binding protein, chloroplastic [Symbiodinium microadriaticum]
MPLPAGRNGSAGRVSQRLQDRFCGMDRLRDHRRQAMAKAVRVISILAVAVCFCSLPAFVPGPARPARSMAPAAAGALSMLGAAPAFADKIDDAAKVEKSYPFLKEIDWTSDVYGKLPTQPPLEVLKAINTMLKMGASMDSAALKSGALAHSQAIANMDSKGVATLADYTAINGLLDYTPCFFESLVEADSELTKYGIGGASASGQTAAKSTPQTQEALVLQCETKGTAGLLGSLKALVQSPTPAPPQSRAPAAVWPSPVGNKGKGKSERSAQAPQSWAIDSRWWPGKLCSASTLEKDLEDGEEPGDDVAAVVTLEQAKASRGLAAAHTLKNKVALILKDHQGSKGPEGFKASKSWIRLVDGKWREAWVVPLSEELPPWGHEPAVVECKSVPEKVKQATLKVTIPKAFQTSYDWDETVRKPASAVRVILPDDLAVRSYGWHKTEQRDEAISGFLKLPESSSLLVLRNSGSKGVFVKRVDNQSDPGKRVLVKWLPIDKMKAPAYYAMAKREADKAKVSLAYRAGGGSCLGLIGVSPGENDDSEASIKRRWAAKGVPSTWFPAQLQQLLASQHWRVISDIQAPARPKGVWTFSAAPPQAQPTSQWFLKCGEQGTIEISPWLRTKAADWLEGNQAAWVLEWYPDADCTEDQHFYTLRPEASPPAKWAKLGLDDSRPPASQSYLGGGRKSSPGSVSSAGSESSLWLRPVVDARFSASSQVPEHPPEKSSDDGASVLLRPVLPENLRIEGSNLEFRSGKSEVFPTTAKEARSSDALLLENAASETSLWLRPAPSHDGRSEGSRRIVGKRAPDFEQRKKPKQAEVASGAVSSEAVVGAGLKTTNVETPTWYCEECKEHVRPTSECKNLGRGLSQARTAHIARRHPGRPSSDFPRIREVATVDAMHQRKLKGKAAWKCFWCRQGLPAMEKRSREASIKKHLQQCKKAPPESTAGSNLQAWAQELDKSHASRGAQSRCWGMILSKKVQGHGKARQITMQKHKLGHRIRHVLRCENDRARVIFTCARCLHVARSRSALVKLNTPCPGVGDRARVLRTTGKQRLYTSVGAQGRRVLKRIWGLTNSGCTNAFEALDLLRSFEVKPLVWSLAEVRASPSEHAALTRRASKMGYKVWCVPSTQGARRQGPANWKGGLCVGVKEGVCCKQMATWCHDEGDLLQLDFGSFRYMAAWRRPGGLRAAFDAEVALWASHAVAAGHSLVAVGDWNDEPHESPFEELGYLIIGPKQQDRYLASRWKGSRAIDWAMTNDPQSAFKAKFLEHRISDHKCLWIEGCFSFNRIGQFSLSRTRDLSRPEHVALEVWRDAVASHFENLEVHWDDDVDVQWTQLAAQLELSLQAAFCCTKFRRQRRDANLTSWRARMAQGGREATRWLKNKAGLLAPALQYTVRGVTTTATSTAGSLALIVDFWKTVWHRPLPKDLHEQLDQMWTEHAPPQAAWPGDQGPLQAHELMKRARNHSKGSAGPDGISAENLADMPVQWWSMLAQLLQLWTAQNKFPASWREARMVLIPKDEVTGVAAEVARLRPITVLNATYRVVAATWTARACVRDWLPQVCPPYFHGGIAGRNAWQALRHIEATWDEEAILISFDFEKCFDNVAPALALDNLRRHGCPENFLKVVAWTWLAQRRWIQYGSFVHPEPQHVSASLPQGCPASPLALTALLLAPATHLQSLMGTELCQSIFVDDRTAVTRSADDTERVITFWASAAKALGLQENQGKLKVVTRSDRQRRLLQAKGIQPSTEANVLGTPFREDGTLEVAGSRLDKFQDQQKLTTNVKRALDVVQQGSRELWLLLAGHWMDVGFALRLASASAFFAADAFWRGQGRQLVTGRWGRAVGSLLQELQFTRTGAHAWQHAGAGAFDLSTGDAAARAKARHLMREAWRRQCYASFLRGQRHELADLVPDDEGYSETVLKAAIKLYNGTSNEESDMLMFVLVFGI